MRDAYPHELAKQMAKCAVTHYHYQLTDYIEDHLQRNATIPDAADVTNWLIETDDGRHLPCEEDAFREELEKRIHRKIHAIYDYMMEYRPACLHPLHLRREAHGSRGVRIHGG